MPHCSPASSSCWTSAARLRSPCRLRCLSWSPQVCARRTEHGAPSGLWGPSAFHADLIQIWGADTPVDPLGRKHRTQRLFNKSHRYRSAPDPCTHFDRRWNERCLRNDMLFSTFWCSIAPKYPFRGSCDGRRVPEESSSQQMREQDFVTPQGEGASRAELSPVFVFRQTPSPTKMCTYNLPPDFDKAVLWTSKGIGTDQPTFPNRVNVSGWNVWTLLKR